MQDYYDAGRVYSGYLCVMIHSDESKAAIWEVVDVGGKRYLQVKDNGAISDYAGCVPSLC